MITRQYYNEPDPFSKSRSGIPRWLIIILILALLTVVYASEYPDSAFSEWTKELTKEITSSANINSSTKKPQYVSVKELALNLGENRGERAAIKSRGFVSQEFITILSQGDLYLYSQDLKYKIAITGKRPSSTSESCGMLSFPYYEVIGEIMYNLNTNSYTFYIESYSMIECIQLSATRNLF